MPATPAPLQFTLVSQRQTAADYDETREVEPWYKHGRSQVRGSRTALLRELLCNSSARVQRWPDKHYHTIPAKLPRGNFSVTACRDLGWRLTAEDTSGIQRCLRRISKAMEASMQG